MQYHFSGNPVLLLCRQMLFTLIPLLDSLDRFGDSKREQGFNVLVPLAGVETVHLIVSCCINVLRRQSPY
jgi:hypothetical protein